MNRYSLSHLSDEALLRKTASDAARERASTAQVLDYLAEFDARNLYLQYSYPSIFAFCVGRFRMDEEEAFERIVAARTARRFPAIFDAVAEGRLNLAAVVMLGPHLTEETVDELMAAATHKGETEIAQLLAERFPSPAGP